MDDRSCLGFGPYLILISLLLGLVFIAAPLAHSRQLRFVTLVYRHGDRSPVHGYPADVHKESAWPQGYGQLTQVGMKQHWDLGQELRARYKGFLNESYNRHEIYVRSTDVDRTLMSAEANLAGLYPPKGSQIFNPNIPWQPVPVHTVPESEDQLLKFPLTNCPAYVKLQEETRQSVDYINMTRDNKGFLEMVADNTGLSDCSLESVWSIYDTLFCEKTHNFSLPTWATTGVLAKLNKLKDFSFVFQFGVHERVKKARLQGGLLVDQILKNITAAADYATNGLKLIAYSAHDSTLGALQIALNVYNGKQAPYASCHIFELFEEASGDFTVQMYFRNESGKTPYPVSLPGCAHACPLEDFQSLLQPIVTQDWKKECQAGGSVISKEAIIGLSVTGVFLFICVVLICISSSDDSDDNDDNGYQHVDDNGDDDSADDNGDDDSADDNGDDDNGDNSLDDDSLDNKSVDDNSD
ncbi:lysosomal acid phosphatase L homeolog [Xenopus laevis]|uniref:Lysosomal acid phosphatase n=3 Tax=Xenopus laevis TaxID=8355 RepID=A0A8J0PW24_XENLA|nr:lysosomal acid phosphatase L homeolog [Xenopus laevis]